jgi:peptidoglycan/LPS O-acetylase OafA/YrhL
MGEKQGGATRFDALDGVRGLAAIAVMVLHYTEHNGLHWLPGAWVAVDLFFVLSGFVIAYSYAGRIRAGLSLTAFVSMRWLRLGPLYTVGLALGVVSVLVASSHDPSAPIALRDVFQAAGVNLLWLPYFNDVAWSFAGGSSRGVTFPLNVPAWSLFFEAFVNIVFFAYVRRYWVSSSIRLACLAVVVFMAATVWSRAINPGWMPGNFIYGFPRVAAAFFVGALIHELRVHELRVPRALACGVAAACLACFLSSSLQLAMVNTLVLAPLTIAATAGQQLGGLLRRACSWLGELSYPLYIVHYPLFQLAYEMFGLRSVDPRLQVLSVGTLAIGIAWALARADRALRGWLQRPSTLRASAKPV